MKTEHQDKKNVFTHDQLALHQAMIVDTILNNSNDTIYFKDKDSRFILSSKAHAAHFNESDPENVIGKTDLDYFPEDFAKKAIADEKKIMETGTPIIGILEKWVKPNGQVLWFSASKYPLYDTEGKTIGTWGTSRDVTPMKLVEEELEKVNAQLKEANRQLEILSSKDSLSGLYNHRHFYEEMKRLFALYLRQKKKGAANTFSIIVFDIDFFKTINDSYGHLIGDLAIRHIAGILVGCVRQTDRAFRYGGDEFVILLNDTSASEARDIGEKIRISTMNTPLMHSKNEIKITISGGVCGFDEAKDVNELLEKADGRLYHSKKNGRNKIT